LRFGDFSVSFFFCQGGFKNTKAIIRQKIAISPQKRPATGDQRPAAAGQPSFCLGAPLGKPLGALDHIGQIARGAGTKKSTDPPVHLLNPRPTHPPSDFFFPLTFFSTFLGASRQGEFENAIKIVLQKVHVENFSQTNRQKFRCQVFLGFFGFIAFSGVSQRWEFKNTTKTFRVDLFLQKNRPIKKIEKILDVSPIFYKIF
jgi:hypothetical protein